MLLSNQTVASGLGNVAADGSGAASWTIRAMAGARSIRFAILAILQRYNPDSWRRPEALRRAAAGGRPLFGAGIALSEDAQKRERTLASRTWILPVAPQGERDGGRELREVVLWATRHRIPSDIVLRGKKIIGDVPNAAAAAFAHLRSIAGRSNHWHFLTILEPEPNPDSRVLLDDRTDALGLPRVKLDWRLRHWRSIR